MEAKPCVTGSFSASCGGYFIEQGYEEVVVPSLWEQRTFIEKGGAGIVSQMYAFDDKKGRPICLVPEITGLIQDVWKSDWQRGATKPRRVFYEARCFRYERPQRGRYREFTQLGVELLGGAAPDDRDELEALLRQLLDRTGVAYELVERVQRGLGYYLDDGFEAVCPALGAQKQVAGGGRYAEGVGWAIGIDRLLLALEQTPQ